MGPPIRILVIDDDEDIRKILVAVLEKEGYKVDTAKNGKEAIEKSRKNFYNMSLVDVKLPDMEGIRLLTRIKDTTPKMVKIIITGYPSLQNAIGAVNQGADSFIVKPFKMESILQTIKKCLKKQQEAKEYSQKKVTEFIQTRAIELEAAS
ncbi:MAG: response regulator [Candidatus Bathyarchaeota archaeon]|nr:MAG: response regulator [Candidatus Bathyarchaeota archaeon]